LEHHQALEFKHIQTLTQVQIRRIQMLQLVQIQVIVTLHRR